MKKYILFYVIILTCITNIDSQSLTPQVIASSGNSFSSSNVKVDFTIGEPLTSTLSGGNIDLTQGFHQSEIKFSGLEDYTDDFAFNLYPNPTTQFVTLKTDREMELKANVYDMNGKSLLHTGVFVSTITIDLNNLGSGNYLLMVSDVNGQPLKSYSIIKKLTN